MTFSSTVNVRCFTSGNDLQAHTSWLTADELSSMKKRAKKLSMLHYIKTRPGEPTPSDRSDIVYNCHPAHYEIIGESLRGMEHYSGGILKAHRRELLRSDAIAMVEEHQNIDKTTRSKLACIYRESAKEALVYAKEKAEEDANAAAAILAEDLKKDFASPPSTPPTVAPSTLNFQGLYSLKICSLHCTHE